MWWFGRVVVAAMSIAVGAGALGGCGGVSSKSGGGSGVGASAGADAGSSVGGGGGGGSEAGGTAGTAGMKSDPCAALAQEYASALQQARACDPALQNSCSLSFDEGLSCSCTTFVNPENTDDVALARDIQLRFAEAGCETPACGPCPQAMAAFCNGEGLCVAITATAAGAACRVEGVDYPSGSGGIPSPSDCNTCSCQDGGLGCTLIGCDTKPCPENHVLSSQCLECGAEGCRLMEYGCLPICIAPCDGGSCVDGVCKAFCD